VPALGKVLRDVEGGFEGDRDDSRDQAQGRLALPCGEALPESDDEDRSDREDRERDDVRQAEGL